MEQKVGLRILPMFLSSLRCPVSSPAIVSAVPRHAAQNTLVHTFDVK